MATSSWQLRFLFAFSILAPYLTGDLAHLSLSPFDQLGDFSWIEKLSVEKAQDDENIHAEQTKVMDMWAYMGL